MRGEKRTVWEGGIRVVAFASGGFLPSAVRGTKQHGLMCLHDLYATFAALAGVTDLQSAPTSSMFPVDAMDMSNLLLAIATESPRDTVLVGNTPCGADSFAACGGNATAVINAVIYASYGKLFKLVVGNSLKETQWGDGHTFCGRTAEQGCLYELNDDEGERRNLAREHPGWFAKLLDLADRASVYPYPQSGWTTRGPSGPFAPFLDDVQTSSGR